MRYQNENLVEHKVLSIECDWGYVWLQQKIVLYSQFQDQIDVNFIFYCNKRTATSWRPIISVKVKVF